MNGTNFIECTLRGWMDTSEINCKTFRKFNLLNVFQLKSFQLRTIK